MKRYVWVLMAALFIAPAAVNAALLTVDLSTTNQITITATGEVSDATVSGSDGIGVYLDGFFSAFDVSVGDILVGGDLTSAQNTSDGSPDLFSFSTDPTGLNIFSYTDDLSSDFVAGSLAFAGSATWTVSAEAYAAALGGAASGLIYFPADDLTDLGSATVIGEWQKTVVPVPAAVWLFGSALAGLGFFRSRRTTS